MKKNTLVLLFLLVGINPYIYAKSTSLPTSNITKQNADNAFMEYQAGNTKSAYTIALYLLQNKNQLKDINYCRKIIFFLIDSSSVEPKSLLKLSQMFKEGVCLKKNKTKSAKYYNKYLNLMK